MSLLDLFVKSFFGELNRIYQTQRLVISAKYTGLPRIGHEMAIPFTQLKALKPKFRPRLSTYSEKAHEIKVLSFIAYTD